MWEINITGSRTFLRRMCRWCSSGIKQAPQRESQWNGPHFGITLISNVPTVHRRIFMSSNHSLSSMEQSCGMTGSIFPSDQFTVMRWTVLKRVSVQQTKGVLGVRRSHVCQSGWAQWRCSDEVGKRARIRYRSFERCWKSHAKRDTVLQDYEEERDLGVNGTPTFFVNGEKVQAGYITLSAAVEKVLSQFEQRL